MKKIVSLVLALMLAVSCFAFASAEEKEVDPVSSVNMETYGDEDSTVAAAIDPERIGDDQCLVYSVYGVDLYGTEDIRALQAGDTLLVNSEELTVTSVEESEYGFDINGGFFCDEGEGASLIYVDGDPDHLYSVTYNDVASMTMVGEAAYAMADEVLVKSYRMTEDLDFSGEYDEVKVPAAEVKAYLTELVEKLGDLVPSTCSVRLENGKVAEIDVDWSPNA